MKTAKINLLNYILLKDHGCTDMEEFVLGFAFVLELIAVGLLILLIIVMCRDIYRNKKMRIIKTSAEKAEEKERWKIAHDQALICPECGSETSVWERFKVKNRYLCKCKNCGCEWETDSW